LENNQCKWSALSCAYMRAYHAKNDSPLIFDDFLAYSLITDEVRTSLEDRLANPVLEFLYPDRASALARTIQAISTPPIILGRARYVEDNLDQAVKNGVHQYVLLGAGMDTFAFRRPEMLELVRVFEIDYPATQAFKLQRIAELGWQSPQGLHFLPVDFTRESLAVALTHSPYDPQSLSFFNWMGVSYYLPRATVLDTFRAIAEIAPGGSIVAFDYFDIDAIDPEKAARRVSTMLENSKRGQEILQTFLDPTELASDLASVGLRLCEDLSSDVIQERYFQGRTDGYHALEHAHFAMAMVAEKK